MAPLPTTNIPLCPRFRGTKRRSVGLHTMMQEWWQQNFIYGIDVGKFCDGNGDGIGDFTGLTSKLDHLSRLGVQCIWLLPFYPSGGKDNGYDITNYYQVDPAYGSLDDFIHFLHRAGEYGIRVVIDLVADHTSDKHPWFLAGCQNEDSRYRDYYYWTNHPEIPDEGKGPMFPGKEENVWQYNETARAFYHHRFYKEEPSLNPTNPEVLNEIKQVIDFWMSFGIAGFRIDAANHIGEVPKPFDAGKQNTHTILKELFSEVKKMKQDGVMMGEVDEPANKLDRYADGEQMNLVFNFFMTNYLFLALAQENAEPISRAYADLPELHNGACWINFLRNLDELDLERLDKDEQESVFKKYAPNDNMRIYGRGIRRRLAPMMGSRQKYKMALSLLFSLPGAVFIPYGDEIGIGENLSAEERKSVRVSMQWIDGKNAGFSNTCMKKSDPALVQEGKFRYEKINVEDQEHDENSPLHLIRTLATTRRQYPIFSRKNFRILALDNPEIFAHEYSQNDIVIIIAHNLSGNDHDIVLPDIKGARDIFTDVFTGEKLMPQSQQLSVKLPAYGYRWLVQDKGKADA